MPVGPGGKEAVPPALPAIPPPAILPPAPAVGGDPPTELPPAVDAEPPIALGAPPFELVEADPPPPACEVGPVAELPAASAGSPLLSSVDDSAPAAHAKAKRLVAVSDSVRSLSMAKVRRSLFIRRV